MTPTFQHRSNGLHLFALARWIVIAAFLGATGLSYVYLKNQLNTCGVQRKALEQELHELIVQNNGLEAQIFRLTSHASLQRRLDEGFLKMVPINAQAVVHVRPMDTNRLTASERDQQSQYQTVSRESYQRP